MHAAQVTGWPCGRSWRTHSQNTSRRQNHAPVITCSNVQQRAACSHVAAARTPGRSHSLSSQHRLNTSGRRAHQNVQWGDQKAAASTLGPCRAWSGLAAVDDLQGPMPKYQKIVGVAAGALLLCNLHRSTFSVLLPELGQRLGLSPSQAGLINAAMLATYLVGQIPAGHLADVYGGMRVLLWGLALWSLGIAATAYAPASAHPLALLLLSRACVGLASAGIMPCIAAMSTKFVPTKDRGRTIALVWSLFNVGGVIGLALAPLVSAAVGVGQAFQAAGALGLAWAAAGGLYLAYLEPEPLPVPATVELTRSTGFTSKAKSTGSLAIASGAGLRGLARSRSTQAVGSSGYGAASTGNTKSQVGSSTYGKDAGWNRLSSSSGGGSSSQNIQERKTQSPNTLQFPGPFSEWGLPKPPWAWFQKQQVDEQPEAQGWQEQQLGAQQQQQAQMLPLLQQQQQLLKQQEEVLQQEMQLQQQQQRRTEQQRQQQQTQFAKAGAMHISRQGWREVGVLCMAHGVIGAGFFILQAWAPTYIASLGRHNLEVTGLLSSLPWVAAAAVGMVAGAVADRLITRKPWQAQQAGQPIITRPSVTTAAADAAAMLSQRLFVRRVMQSISFLGCAVSALPLALDPTPSLALAIGCLTANCGFYAVSYGGFHAHLQDVAGPYAGKVQGASNTCSIAMGVAGTLATGIVLERTGSYTPVFGVLAALYVAATVLWNALITGQPIFDRPTSSVIT